ncbi:MAG: hypothetical protein AAF039_12120 [Bacteroidota bacterium]
MANSIGNGIPIVFGIMGFPSIVATQEIKKAYTSLFALSLDCQIRLRNNVL